MKSLLRVLVGHLRTWQGYLVPWGGVVLLPVWLFAVGGQSSPRTTPAGQTGTIQTGTTKSPHGALNIPCGNCHTFTSWKPIRQAPDFDHRKTRYPLVGGHRSLDCTSCHTSLVFSKASSRCADCHADLHRGQFGTSCDRCHTVRKWETATPSALASNHQNRFPLVLAHAVADCAACHKNAAVGQFQGLSTQCYSCHARDFQTAIGPNHVASRFSTTCEQCHTMSSWQGAKFDHAQTGFALMGAHTTVACVACHVSNNYTLTSANTACASCHMADYRSTTNPNHVTGRLPTKCDQCHNVNNWQSASFDHSTTGFALTGAHGAVACVACHVNNNYNLTAANAACSACHMTDYRNTTNPKHAGAAFPTDCSLCHSTTNWSGAVFNHAATGWPLTGAHQATACTACHVNGNYNLTAANTACFGCHQNDFAHATSPVNHTAFPTSCDSCHNTTTWTGATFNHSSTGFPLTGAHTSLACAACHVNNNYSLTSANTTCVSCHLTDYKATNSPNHQAASFPTTCETCHSTTTWAGATFNHTYFPLNHGNANGQCTTCHTNGSNYAVFQCTGCHGASQTNSRHSGVSGYVYNSVNCYTCHPRGSGGG